MKGPQAGSWHEELLKRRKANTHKERRKEGRTIHTKASKTSITIASIALIFNAMAIAMPHWRSSWVALIGYGARRHWGLLAVQGRKMTMHHTMFENNCKWHGTLMLGNSCLSPICKWYLLKCQVYFDLCLYSYGAAFFVLLALLIHVLCLIWTCMLSTRSLRWAATWWPVAALFHLGVRSSGWSSLRASFFIACVGGFGQCVCVFIAFQLMKTWPEVDPDDPNQFMSDSSEPEEDDETEEVMKVAQPLPTPGPMTTVPGPVPPADSAPTETERQWYYKDKGGQEQRPFPTSIMLGWYGQGSIGSDLELRRDDEDSYSPLGDGSRFRQ